MSAIEMTKRVAIALATVLAVLVAASSAHAEFGVQPGSFSVGLHDNGGNPVTQAGAHPNLSVAFSLNEATDEFGNGTPDESLRDVVVELPPGIVGDPEATPRCQHRDFQTFRCSRFSLIGVTRFRFKATPTRGPPLLQTVPIFNLVPPRGTVARMGFQVFTASVILDVKVRSDGGYNLVTELGNVSQILQIFRSELELWGVPADLNGAGPLNFDGPPVTYGAPSGAPRRPFLTAPFECGGGPRTTMLRLRSWQQPDRWTHDEHTDDSAFEGCDRLSFAPSLEIEPDQRVANAPSGLEARVIVPQDLTPDGLGTPHVRDVELTLPAGVAISPASADGLQGCTDAQAGLGSAADPDCPNASKIGSVAIDTPALPEQLTGSVYVGAPKSNDAQTGEMVRLLAIASGQGVTVKLEGKITPDPVTGQMRVAFRDNPRLPFSRMTMKLQGGPRAAVTTPRACGTYTSSTTITSWSGARATSTSSFEIGRKSDGSACGPDGFSPSFSAGMTNPAAGGTGAFSLTFGRGDQDQDLRDVTVQMPRGLTGVLASVTECPEAQAAAGACGEESRIGSVTSGAGAGASPLYLPGRVYLTGPYKGAPLGLSIVVPAQAGPFDLGTVAVRSGTAADRGSRFQAANCAALPFKPKMTLTVGKRGRTKPRITVPLRAEVDMSKGHANLRSVSVNLPLNINARLAVINSNACSLADYEAGRCAASRAIGTATAITPLLKQPLAGNVYFVRNPARRLPDMVMALRGQVDVDVVGKVAVPRNLTLATTFDTIPDVPISKFALNLRAGRSGPIGTVGNLCRASVRRAMRARLAFVGQSNKVVRRTQAVKVDGCARTIQDRRARRGRRGRPKAKAGRGK